MLQAIDKLWQQHITDMDALREGVRLRAQGQRDPLVEYKREAYEIFETLMNNINFEILNGMFRSTTNLSAFEDFLASLPASNADEEDADVMDILGNGDLLSALRERLAGLAGAAAEPDELPDFPESVTESMPQMPELPVMGESISGAMETSVPRSEKKMVLPKKKKTFVNIKRPEGSGDLVMVSPEMMPEEDEGVTIGSIDSGHMPVAEEDEAPRA